MKVLVSGSTGLIGTALVRALEAGVHSVVRLVRGAAQPGGIVWDPLAGKLDPAAIEGIDAAVHLAGENIASGRWTAAKKQRIRESRVQGTKLLAETLAKLQKPPAVFLSGSAIGWYANRGDEVVREEAPAGSGFLADVCRQWEAAGEAVLARGIRLLKLRTGVVLSGEGGVLARMLPPFRLGMGGRVGDGKQWMSWIAIDDVVAAILHAIAKKELAGPVNFVSPAPVTNAEFTRTLGHLLGRPTIVPMPAFAARWAFGEMADELLLASTRVEPRKLAASGYGFRYPDLESALSAILGKSAGGK